MDEARGNPALMRVRLLESWLVRKAKDLLIREIRPFVAFVIDGGPPSWVKREDIRP